MTWFLLKLTVLLTTGAALAALLRNRSAATRHFAWALTLIGALLFAIAAAVGVRMPMHVPVDVPEWRPATTVVANTPVIEVSSTKVETPLPAPQKPSFRFNPTMVWAIGVAVMLTWLLIGHLGLARITRRATSAPWTSLVDEAIAQSDVTKPVRVVLSESVLVPVTWRWRHPVVLLPAEAVSWPIDRQRAALMHELAHIARNDFLTQLLASLACALYWFHPFAWFSLRRLRRESEQASDDRVLAHGLRAPDYATHLVDVAVAARARRFGGLLALGMACPSHLETRLHAMLDETRKRNGLSPRTTVVAVAIAAMILLPLAAAQPALRVATDIGKPIDFARTANRIERAVTRPVNRAFHMIGRGASALGTGSGMSSAAQQSIDAAPGETLTLDLETGGSVEVTGWNEPRVAVDYRLGGRDANDTRVSIERSADGVRVSSTFAGQRSSRSTSHDFVIQVPARFNVKLHSSGGSLSIENVEGVFNGSTGGGEITLRDLKGRADLNTGGGEIDVEDVELDGKVSTGGGAVNLRNVRGNLRGWSGSEGVFRSGNIDEGVLVQPDDADRGEDSGDDDSSDDSARDSLITIGTGDSVTTYINDEQAKRRAANGELQIGKAGGDIELDDAPKGAVVRTGGGEIHIGSAGNDVVASTGGGRIEIGPVAGSVHASTGAGDVTVTLVDPNGREQNVAIFTGSGDVEVVLPATLDAKFLIETAYTRRNAPTHIDSTWELDHEPVTDWDGHEGTPRRYVRASGSAGSGRGLVKIKAVNGNVTLRRGR